MEDSKKPSIFSKPWVQSVIGILIIVLATGGFLYWKLISAYVVIDTSVVSAPLIGIGPEAEGILSQVYVNVGDTVTADEPVAQVGSETLSTKTSGQVVSVENNPGQVFMPGQSVVSMIEPSQLRIIGTIDENKGLSRIKVGDPATFTVDAFGSTVFMGVVDEISPTSNESGVVFNISDKRETKQFDIKIRYDVAQHPELKNGMSAKLKIYAQ